MLSLEVFIFAFIGVTSVHNNREFNELTTAPLGGGGGAPKLNTVFTGNFIMSHK